MHENMKSMCCGGNEFKLYTTEQSERLNIIIVECIKCKDLSTLKPTQPKIKIGWGENSKGVLCINE